MKFVGVRELKDKLSNYIKRAEAGERVVITDRGKPVAELRPFAGEKALAPDAWQDLIDRGVVRPGTGNRGVKYPKMKRVLPLGTAQRLLDEERGDR